MSDYLIRATAAEGQIRALAACTTALVEEARRRHDLYPTATAALGRALTAGSLLGVTLKGEDILTLRIIGDGPLGAVVVTADSGGRVRGYVQEPRTHLPLNAQGKLDVAGAVGQGYLHITRDLGLKDPYTGSVPLVSGEIAEDLAHYFLTSEQTPSAVALGVLVNKDASVGAAGGFLIQVLPGAENEVVDLLEKNLGQLPSISEMIAQDLRPEDILEKILAGMEIKVHEKLELSFSCNCSKERLEKILITLGEDLREMAEEDEGARLRCHFCSENYSFSREELQVLCQQAQSE